MFLDYRERETHNKHINKLTVSFVCQWNNEPYKQETIQDSLSLKTFKVILFKVYFLYSQKVKEAFAMNRKRASENTGSSVYNCVVLWQCITLN